MVLNSFADNDKAGWVNAEVPAVSKTGREKKTHFLFYFSCDTYRIVAILRIQMEKTNTCLIRVIICKLFALSIVYRFSNYMQI